MSHRKRPADPPRSDDVDRRAILARRSRMITAALAGAGIAASVGGCEPPRPCLSVRPCLSEVIIERPDGSGLEQPEADAGVQLPPADGGSDAAAQIAVDPPPQPCLKPGVCLSFVPPPKPSATPPRPCLRPAPPPAKMCLRAPAPQLEDDSLK